KDLLKGNLNPVIQYFKQQMKTHIANLEFEKAAVIQSKLNYLNEYQSRSVVVNSRSGTVDVFSMLQEGDTAYVNYLAVSNGSIIQTHTLTLSKKLEEDA